MLEHRKYLFYYLFFNVVGFDLELLSVQCHIFKWASCLILKKSKQFWVSFLYLTLAPFYGWSLRNKSSLRRLMDNKYLYT